MELLKHKSLKPGTWIRIPIIYETQCNTQQNNAYHHAIIICPLLEIGFNVAGIIIDKLHITSTNKLYDCSKYEIINEPCNYNECLQIITRALTYYGAKKYNQMFNNCEHFASYCFNNKSESKQVKHTLWNNTSKVHQFFQKSSIFTNTVLFLHSLDIVSDQTVDSVCNINHEIGAVNGDIIDFCNEKVEANKIENEYNIKQMNDENIDIKEEKKEMDIPLNELHIVKEAKYVRTIIKENLNDEGRIDKDKVDSIMKTISPILMLYYVENT